MESEGIFFRLLGCEWSINDTLHPPFLEGELDSFTDVRMNLLKAAGFLIFQLIAQSHGLISNNKERTYAAHEQADESL